MKAMIITIYGIAGIAYSQASEMGIRLESGIVFSHFQQQVKQNVGDERGNRLVNEFQIGGVFAAGTGFSTHFMSEYFPGSIGANGTGHDSTDSKVNDEHRQRMGSAECIPKSDSGRTHKSNGNNC